MLAPEKKDYSNMLLCPMPGTLVSIAVEEGSHVVDGQPIAVVEAMKMQNILRAEKKGVVKSVNCKAGDTLKTDQIIVEYEQDE
jgi:propionyl-CoA carboxylase alpha chain